MYSIDSNKHKNVNGKIITIIKWKEWKNKIRVIYKIEAEDRSDWKFRWVTFTIPYKGQVSNNDDTDNDNNNKKY